MNTYGALQHIAVISASRSSLNHSFIDNDDEESSRYTTAIDTTPLLRHTIIYHRRILQDRRSRNALINWRVCSLILLFMSGVIIGGYLICKENNDWPSNFPYYLIELKDWYKGNTTDDDHDIPWLPIEQISNIIVTHTRTDRCTTYIHCTNIINNVMIKHNLFDIPFNFLISNSGETYEVRGWRFTSGFTNNSIHNDSLAMGFIGDFSDQKLTNEQLAELQAFIVEASRRKQLRSDYKIYGVRSHQLDGKKMFEKLKLLNHWHGFV